MNCEGVAWALALDLKPSSAKWVLVAIASEIKDGVLQASQAEIARIVGVTDRSVRSALKTLEEQGYIKRTPNPGRGAGRMADTISLGQPEAQQPEKSSAGKKAQPENPASGKQIRTNRKSIPHQPEKSSADQPETVAAEPVDNQASAYIGTQARAETPLTKTTTLEAKPLEVELDQPPPTKVLNGSAKTLPSVRLAEIIVEQINSRALDPARYAGLHLTHGRIKSWMDAGADFDADILPAVREGCATLERKHEGAQGWNYFDKAVKRYAERRKAAEAKTETYEAHHEQRFGAADAPRVRRDPISPTTAARMRRRAGRQADSEPIDLGRLDSERIV